MKDLDLYKSLIHLHEFRRNGLHLLNASVIPVGADGVWNVREVSQELAHQLHIAAIETSPSAGDGWSGGVFSHVGHEGTAQAITALHGTAVEVDRSPWDGSGIGLAFTLKARQREGEILTLERVREVGFVWRLLLRVGI